MISRPVVVGIGGPPLSGKSTLAAELALSLSIPKASFGDFVRARVKETGGNSADIRILQTEGAKMVSDQPELLCRKVLESGGWRPGGSIILEGVRHATIAEILQRIVAPVDFLLVLIFVPEEARQYRLEVREEELGFSLPSLAEIDAGPTERDVTTNRLLRLAHYVIDGSAPIEKLTTRLSAWIVAKQSAQNL